MCTFMSLSGVQNKIIFMSFPQWPALQLAWLAQWIKRCVRLSQRSWFDSQSILNFFRFFSNRLGCWFYRGDHVHFHITMNFGQDRLRVVPHFSSGIVERAKRESGENHPTRESRFFSLGVILTRACISLDLLSLRTSGGLLVVYGQDDFRATWLLVTEVVILLGASCYRNRVKRNMSVPTR